MSAAALFVPGRGSRWDPRPEHFKDLMRRLRVLAQDIWFTILDCLQPGQTTTTELITDRELSRRSGWSERSVQLGLWILEYVAKVIRRDRAHGRRTITITCQLRGRSDRRPVAGAEAPPPPAPPQPPPQTPPKEFEKTTTESRSSSSPQILPKKTSDAPAIVENTPTSDDPTIAELVARACRLIPEASPGPVRAAIAQFSAEWVSLALDVVEKRNRKPGMKRVTSWGFVRRILENRRQEDWTPPEAKPAPQPPVAVKAPAEPSSPLPLLLPAELAGLVAQCSQRDALGRLAAIRIRMAVRDGQVPAELVPSIPAEILAGPEVPAPGSGS